MISLATPDSPVLTRISKAGIYDISRVVHWRISCIVFNAWLIITSGWSKVKIQCSSWQDAAAIWSERFESLRGHYSFHFFVLSANNYTIYFFTLLIWVPIHTYEFTFSAIIYVTVVSRLAYLPLCPLMKILVETVACLCACFHSSCLPVILYVYFSSAVLSVCLSER